MFRWFVFIFLLRYRGRARQPLNESHLFRVRSA
jgi:hypothetical protein